MAQFKLDFIASGSSSLIRTIQQLSKVSSAQGAGNLKQLAQQTKAYELASRAALTLGTAGSRGMGQLSQQSRVLATQVAASSKILAQSAKIAIQNGTAQQAAFNATSKAAVQMGAGLVKGVQAVDGPLSSLIGRLNQMQSGSGGMAKAMSTTAQTVVALGNSFATAAVQYSGLATQTARATVATLGLTKTGAAMSVFIGRNRAAAQTVAALGAAVAVATSGWFPYIKAAGIAAKTSGLASDILAKNADTIQKSIGLFVAGGAALTTALGGIPAGPIAGAVAGVAALGAYWTQAAKVAQRTSIFTGKALQLSSEQFKATLMILANWRLVAAAIGLSYQNLSMNLNLYEVIDLSMARIQTKLKASNHEMTRFQKTLSKISSEFGVLRGDLAATADALIVGEGLDFTEAETALKNISVVTQSTGLMMAETTRLLLDASNALGSEDISKSIDRINTATVSANTNLGDLATAVQLVGRQVIGSSAETETSILTVVAALQSMGLDAQQSGGELAQTLQAIQGRIQQVAKQSQDLGEQGFSIQLSVSDEVADLDLFTNSIQSTGDEIAQIFRGPNGEVRSLLEALPELRKALSGMGEGQQGALLESLFGAQGRMTIMTLLKTSQEEIDNLYNRIESQSGQMDLAGPIEDSYAQALSRFQAALDDIQTKIAEAFEPIQTYFLNIATSILEITEVLNPIVEKVLLFTTQLAPLFATIATIVGPIAQLWLVFKVLLPLFGTYLTQIDKGILAYRAMAEEERKLAKMEKESAQNREKLAEKQRKTEEEAIERAKRLEELRKQAAKNRGQRQGQQFGDRPIPEATDTERKASQLESEILDEGVKLGRQLDQQRIVQAELNALEIKGNLLSSQKLEYEMLLTENLEKQAKLRERSADARFIGQFKEVEDQQSAIGGVAQGRGLDDSVDLFTQEQYLREMIGESTDAYADLTEERKSLNKKQAALESAIQETNARIFDRQVELQNLGQQTGVTASETLLAQLAQREQDTENRLASATKALIEAETKLEGKRKALETTREDRDAVQTQSDLDVTRFRTLGEELSGKRGQKLQIEDQLTEARALGNEAEAAALEESLEGVKSQISQIEQQRLLIAQNEEKISAALAKQNKLLADREQDVALSGAEVSAKRDDVGQIDQELAYVRSQAELIRSAGQSPGGVVPGLISVENEAAAKLYTLTQQILDATDRLNAANEAVEATQERIEALDKEKLETTNKLIEAQAKLAGLEAERPSLEAAFEEFGMQRKIAEETAMASGDEKDIALAQELIKLEAEFGTKLQENLQATVETTKEVSSLEATQAELTDRLADEAFTRRKQLTEQKRISIEARDLQREEEQLLEQQLQARTALIELRKQEGGIGKKQKQQIEEELRALERERDFLAKSIGANEQDLVEIEVSMEGDVEQVKAMLEQLRQLDEEQSKITGEIIDTSGQARAALEMMGQPVSADTELDDLDFSSLDPLEDLDIGDVDSVDLPVTPVVTDLDTDDLGLLEVQAAIDQDTFSKGAAIEIPVEPVIEDQVVTPLDLDMDQPVRTDLQNQMPVEIPVIPNVEDEAFLLGVRAQINAADEIQEQQARKANPARLESQKLAAKELNQPFSKDYAETVQDAEGVISLYSVALEDIEAQINSLQSEVLEAESTLDKVRDRYANQGQQGIEESRQKAKEALEFVEAGPVDPIQEAEEQRASLQAQVSNLGGITSELSIASGPDALEQYALAQEQLAKAETELIKVEDRLRSLRENPPESTWEQDRQAAQDYAQYLVRESIPAQREFHETAVAGAEADLEAKKKALDALVEQRDRMTKAVSEAEAALQIEPPTVSADPKMAQIDSEFADIYKETQGMYGQEARGQSRVVQIEAERQALQKQIEDLVKGSEQLGFAEKKLLAEFIDRQRSLPQEINALEQSIAETEQALALAEQRLASAERYVDIDMGEDGGGVVTLDKGNKRFDLENQANDLLLEADKARGKVFDAVQQIDALESDLQGVDLKLEDVIEQTEVAFEKLEQEIGVLKAKQAGEEADKTAKQIETASVKLENLKAGLEQFRADTEDLVDQVVAKIQSLEEESFDLKVVPEGETEDEAAARQQKLEQTQAKLDALQEKAAAAEPAYESTVEAMEARISMEEERIALLSRKEAVLRDKAASIPGDLQDVELSDAELPGPDEKTAQLLAEMDKTQAKIQETAAYLTELEGQLQGIDEKIIGDVDKAADYLDSLSAEISDLLVGGEDETPEEADARLEALDQKMTQSNAIQGRVESLEAAYEKETGQLKEQIAIEKERMARLQKMEAVIKRRVAARQQEEISTRNLSALESKMAKSQALQARAEALEQAYINATGELREQIAAEQQRIAQLLKLEATIRDRAELRKQESEQVLDNIEAEKLAAQEAVKATQRDLAEKKRQLEALNGLQSKADQERLDAAARLEDINTRIRHLQEEAAKYDPLDKEYEQIQTQLGGLQEEQEFADRDLLAARTSQTLLESDVDAQRQRVREALAEAENATATLNNQQQRLAKTTAKTLSMVEGLSEGYARASRKAKDLFSGAGELAGNIAEKGNIKKLYGDIIEKGWSGAVQGTVRFAKEATTAAFHTVKATAKAVWSRIGDTVGNYAADFLQSVVMFMAADALVKAFGPPLLEGLVSVFDSAAGFFGFSLKESLDRAFSEVERRLRELRRESDRELMRQPDQRVEGTSGAVEENIREDYIQKTKQDANFFLKTWDYMQEIGAGLPGWLKGVTALVGAALTLVGGMIATLGAVAGATFLGIPATIVGGVAIAIGAIVGLTGAGNEAFRWAEGQQRKASRQFKEDFDAIQKRAQEIRSLFDSGKVDPDSSAGKALIEELRGLSEIMLELDTAGEVTAEGLQTRFSEAVLNTAADLEQLADGALETISGIVNLEDAVSYLDTRLANLEDRKLILEYDAQIALNTGEIDEQGYQDLLKKIERETMETRLKEIEAVLPKIRESETESGEEKANKIRELERETLQIKMGLLQQEVEAVKEANQEILSEIKDRLDKELDDIQDASNLKKLSILKNEGMTAEQREKALADLEDDLLATQLEKARERLSELQALGVLSTAEEEEERLNQIEETEDQITQMRIQKAEERAAALDEINELETTRAEDRLQSEEDLKEKLAEDARDLQKELQANEKEFYEAQAQERLDFEEEILNRRDEFEKDLIKQQEDHLRTQLEEKADFEKNQLEEKAKFEEDLQKKLQKQAEDLRKSEEERLIDQAIEREKQLALAKTPTERADLTKQFEEEDKKRAEELKAEQEASAKVEAERLKRIDDAEKAGLIDTATATEMRRAEEEAAQERQDFEEQQRTAAQDFQTQQREATLEFEEQLQADRAEFEDQLKVDRAEFEKSQRDAEGDFLTEQRQLQLDFENDSRKQWADFWEEQRELDRDNAEAIAAIREREGILTRQQALESQRGQMQQQLKLLQGLVRAAETNTDPNITYSADSVARARENIEALTRNIQAATQAIASEQARVAEIDAQLAAPVAEAQKVTLDSIPLSAREQQIKAEQERERAELEARIATEGQFRQEQRDLDLTNAQKIRDLYNTPGNIVDLGSLLQARRYGGPVQPGQVYQVNEAGQEWFKPVGGSPVPIGLPQNGLFSPSVAGHVIPAHLGRNVGKTGGASTGELRLHPSDLQALGAMLSQDVTVQAPSVFYNDPSPLQTRLQLTTASLKMRRGV